MEKQKQQLNLEMYWDSVITHPKNGHHIACYDINKKIEVIGNIYDNKELLEG